MKGFLDFLKSEDGELIQYLIKTVIVGLGGAAIYFGILAAARQKGGELIGAIRNVEF